MNMQINIKSLKARELADEITKRTGETITEAVTAALKERLRQLTIGERKAAVRKIVEELRSEWKEPWKSMDHAELLYDEKGLPK
jgi:antitoxin VapB